MLLCSTATFAGVHVRNLWQHNEVSVCFAKGEEGSRTDKYGSKLKIRDWKEKHKANVQVWVNEEFTPERTGIHFVGWESCERSPNADIVVFHNKNSKFKNFLFGGVSGFALMGPYYNAVEGYPAALGSVFINSSGMKKSVVIHEFGHAAGLAHEHEHKDAVKGCSSIAPLFNPMYEYVPFDAESIMSYCITDKKNRGLSPSDAALLKRLYP